ncbi:hypothetical protein H6F67_06835 [Microcoleus sp. FACHB-1515]|uniref:hypothetical protein n=1 Tax=Cyanophyceae TaxID=3028117 RepID=UPI001689199E|nr:hypothetical protein [Microcoleus sp. FACHB-1515]MBD2089566.1 hypothetical protein [Microcoleus sp. FACHB-1515]
MLNANATISLLAPTRGRPEQAVRLALSVLQTASQPKRVELLFYVDNNDAEQTNYIQAFQQHKSQFDRFLRCALMIGEPIGISKAWNELAARSQGDLLVMAADDQTYNTTGWDDRLLSEIQRFEDEIFCAWFNDGHWGAKLCTFPIVSRRWCLTLGYFTTGLFECLYDDLWIMDLAQRLDRLHYIPNVLTEHLHWSYGKSEIDATYEWKQVNSEGQLKPAVRRDMNLFSRTAPYRETDARRLMQQMNLPLQSLKSGLALMGEASIFVEETPLPVRSLDSRSESIQPTIANLHLPNQTECKLLLKPNLPKQQQMLLAFQQGRYYQPAASQLLMQLLQPGDSFVDLDAEIGYFVALAAKTVGDRGKVIAIESNCDHYAQLLETIRLNRFPQVQATQAEVDATLIDRLLVESPKLLKLPIDQAVRLLLALRSDRTAPNLLCEVKTGFSNWQDFEQTLAASGYTAHELTVKGLQSIGQTVREGSYLLLRTV